QSTLSLSLTLFLSLSLSRPVSLLDRVSFHFDASAVPDLARALNPRSENSAKRPKGVCMALERIEMPNPTQTLQLHRFCTRRHVSTAQSLRHEQSTSRRPGSSQPRGKFPTSRGMLNSSHVPRPPGDMLATGNEKCCPTSCYALDGPFRSGVVT
ncbi:unnamed protein product, partial [Protopolystoma xenopodis]